MRMHRSAALAAALLLSSAQAAAGNAWERLQGQWQGGGEVRGMRAEIRLHFRPGFGGRGFHLDFENRMTAQDGKVWTFAAEALYRCDDAGACSGHWYDSRGMVLPLQAKAEADRVVVEWGDTATERGRTTYRLDGDGIAITDEVLVDEAPGKDGAWKTFGETTAQRAEP